MINLNDESRLTVVYESSDSEDTDYISDSFYDFVEFSPSSEDSDSESEGRLTLSEKVDKLKMDVKQLAQQMDELKKETDELKKENYKNKQYFSQLMQNKKNDVSYNFNRLKYLIKELSIRLKEDFEAGRRNLCFDNLPSLNLKPEELQSFLDSDEYKELNAISGPGSLFSELVDSLRFGKRKLNPANVDLKEIENLRELIGDGEGLCPADREELEKLDDRYEELLDFGFKYAMFYP